MRNGVTKTNRILSNLPDSGPTALFGLSKPWVSLGWGWGQGRKYREEIFDCIACVVGASRCEFLGRAVAVGDSDRSDSVRAGGFDIEVAVTDHERGGGIKGLLFE
jgi:hypothetical protein